MTPFADTTLAEKTNEDGLDPLFLRRQSLSEDLRRWSALEMRLSQLEQTAVSAKGLGSKQVAILQHIALQGGRMNIKALLVRMRVSKQSLHNNLTKILQAGYAHKAGYDPKDRRVRILALTEKGIAFVEGLLEPRARLLRHAYRQASAAQVEGFRRTLLLLSEEGEFIPKAQSRQATQSDE